MPMYPNRVARTATLGRALTALVALAIAVLGVAALSAGTARAATPAAGTTVYQETFENNSSTTPIVLTTYTGTASADTETYSAGASWAGSSCNGFIIDAAELGDNNSNGPPGTDNCYPQDSTWFSAVAMASALGVYQGNSQPTTNHVLADLTGTQTPLGDGIMLETSPAQIPAITGHFYQVRGDYAAAYCPEANDPAIDLYLIGAASPIQVASNMDPCTNPGAVDDTTNSSFPSLESEYDSPAAQWTGGSSMGLEQYNAQPSGNGNDTATDDLRVVDVTPTLSEAISAGSQYAGQPSTLTFTVTNTSELAAKSGWSITQALPSGVTVAASPNVSTTCAGGSIAASGGGSSIAVSGGDIAAGASSCTVSVNVVPASAGTYTIGPAAASPSGLLSAGSAGNATLTAVAANNSLTISQSASPSPYVAGARLTYTVTVANGGPQAATGVEVSDPLPAALQSAGFTWTCRPSAGSACLASGNGGVSDTATVAGGGTVTYTITGIVPASTAGPLNNAVTVTPSAASSDPGCSPSCSTSSATAESAVGTLTGDASVSGSALRSGVAVSGAGGLTIPLRCSSSGSCMSDGVLSITTRAHGKTHTTVLARFTGTQLAAGQSGLVPLHLSSRLMRRLRALGTNPLRATLAITNHHADGTVATTRTVVMLNLPLACIAATGSVTTRGLGHFRLGLSTARARTLGKHQVVGHAYDRFCVTGGTVKVAYASRKLLHRFHITHAGKIRGRVIIVVTGDHHYAVHGVRSGMSLKSARHRLHLGRGNRIGKSTWYVVTKGKAAYLVKVHGRRIREIGVVNRTLIRNRAIRRYLLRFV